MSAWLLLAAILLPCSVGAAVSAGTDAGDSRGFLLSGTSTGPLGARASYLVERGTTLDLAGAQRALQRGNFRLQGRTTAGFGIAAPPAWMHLELTNPSGNPLAYRLLIGMPWLDSLDVYLVHDGRLLQSWRGGDARPGAGYLVPAVGYVFPVRLAPGRNELYVRAYAPEALMLPVSLLTTGDLEAAELGYRYRYGALYGFLLAFAIYNLMLFRGLRERAHLYYALYVLSFVVLSLVYTGHGFMWWWPQQTGFQRNGLFAAMIFYACAGFAFASRFLQLQDYAPSLRRWIGGLSLLVMVSMAVFIAAEFVRAAVYLAFGTFAVFALGMVSLGVFACRRDRTVGHFFLPAALCSMLGLSIGLLCALGLVTANEWTIGAVEIGMMLEAILLSLALGSRMRQQKRARFRAERLARIDGLTGLLNRRAFITDAAALWSTAVRHGRPMSLLLLDIDFFKQFNDRFGHECGDRILERVAKLLTQSCREGDILSRWGGEEFVLLLPETDLAQATVFGERIRREIECNRIAAGFQGPPLTVSLGAAQLQSEITLNDLVDAADQRLYDAKRCGRNRIVPPVAEQVVA
ncbi:sensor domain-containing diguanylate cyclase [Microbulbifer taiwanensis]|uniref:diguanylate cyclase n=1 Tax=Microbulbifer taiwanensis TaxID=986746 RepID=A0ABW1YHZ3_9GAMM|nr:diguanylate cyclase [Microbulbifer taiwanensis]